MTERPRFLPPRTIRAVLVTADTGPRGATTPNVPNACSGVRDVGGGSGPDYFGEARRDSRQAPGETPVAFLNARLKAASDS